MNENVVDLDAKDVETEVTAADAANALEKEVTLKGVTVKMNGKLIHFPHQKTWPVKAVRKYGTGEDVFGLLEAVLDPESMANVDDLTIEQFEQVMKAVSKEIFGAELGE